VLKDANDHQAGN